jgi:hypothetical protein
MMLDAVVSFATVIELGNVCIANNNCQLVPYLLMFHMHICLCKSPNLLCGRVYHVESLRSQGRLELASNEQTLPALHRCC